MSLAQHPLCTWLLSEPLPAVQQQLLFAEQIQACLFSEIASAGAAPRDRPGMERGAGCMYPQPWEGSCSLPATPEVVTLQPAQSTGHEAATPSGVPDPHKSGPYTVTLLANVRGL